MNERQNRFVFLFIVRFVFLFIVLHSSFCVSFLSLQVVVTRTGDQSRQAHLDLSGGLEGVSHQRKHSPMRNLFSGNEIYSIQAPVESGLEALTHSFSSRLRQEGIDLRRKAVETLQINVGRLCNQACSHCHVDAGPRRTEVMTRQTMDKVLSFLAASPIPAVDITGGAPEINPDFRYLVRRAREMGRQVTVRCNLTVLFEPGREDLPAFYRDQEVELICSLPCYLQENVDGQRGKGVFVKSIEALRRLNRVGYGRAETGLLLHLVYNPVEAVLPGPQDELEADYRQVLGEQYGIAFNRLLTIANMPINRFADYLRRRGEYADYMATLRASFNPDTLERLMCRSLVSVDWEGNLYDCDFNQMLGMDLGGSPLKVWEAPPEALAGRRIRVGEHCYGCTAGAGSSCGGALV